MAGEDVFGYRGMLFGLAYRMLGSAADAEEIVQETYLRWHRETTEIADPRAWLTTVAANLSRNRLASAQARRERYVGQWLPEPVATEPGPDELAARGAGVSLAMLSLLERLNPNERAVFVLREAFEYSHREIAQALGCSEANSRQLHRRARARIGEDPPAIPSDDAELARHRELVARFLDAARAGELATLESLLREDVTAVADGGGQVGVARNPVHGRDRVARYLIGSFGRVPEVVGGQFTLRISTLNGGPAVLAFAGDQPLGALVPVVDGERISAVHIIANPEKLRFIEGLSHPGA